MKLKKTTTDKNFFTADAWETNIIKLMLTIDDDLWNGLKIFMEWIKKYLGKNQQWRRKANTILENKKIKS